MKTNTASVEKVVHWLEARGFNQIRSAELEDFESPATFTRQRDEESFTPMFTATKNGQKFYFEIASKAAKEKKERLIQKWSLLAEIAEIKKGDFRVFAPHGMFSFAKRLIENNGIEAQIVKI